MKRNKTVKIAILHSIREAYQDCLDEKMDCSEPSAAEVVRAENRIKDELEQQKHDPEISHSAASTYVEACQQHLRSLPERDAIKLENFTTQAKPFLNPIPIFDIPRPATTKSDSIVEKKTESKEDDQPSAKTVLGLNNFTLTQKWVDRGEAIRTQFRTSPRESSKELKRYGFFAESKNSAAKMTYEMLIQGYRLPDPNENQSDYEIAQKAQDEEIGRFFR